MSVNPNMPKVCSRNGHFRAVVAVRHWKWVPTLTAQSPVCLCVCWDLGAVICLRRPCCSSLWCSKWHSERCVCALYVMLNAAHFEPNADHIWARNATSNGANKQRRKMCLRHQGFTFFFFPFFSFLLFLCNESSLNPESLLGVGFN